MMRTMMAIGLVSIVALGAGCSGSELGTDDEDLATVALGMDTNSSTLDLTYAKSQGIAFVGRYVSDDGRGHPAMTLTEAQTYHTAGMPIVALWEVDKHAVIDQLSIAGEHQLGASDAQKANANLIAIGGGGHPIYFTVDFDITQTLWSQSRKDPKTGKTISVGDLVLAYFEGVNSVIGAPRTGVYGTYIVVKELFDNNRVHYGWQQTFSPHQNDPHDGRAQLRQHDITTVPDANWGVSGPGSFDLDRAVHAHFGQW